MAHNLSWIDPEALERLFAETAHRDIGEDAPASEADDRPYMMGPPRPRPRPRLRPSEPDPRPADPRAKAASVPTPGAPSLRRVTRPAPPAEESEASVEPFSAEATASLEGRLSGLMRWACEATGLTRTLIVDAQGLLVASQRAGVNAMDEAAAVVDLCAHRVLAELSAQESGMLTMVAGSKTHVVAWEATRHGRMYISLSGSAEPPSAALSLLCGALREALR